MTPKELQDQTDRFLKSLSQLILAKRGTRPTAHIAREIGIDKCHAHRLIKGQCVPRVDTLLRVAAWLGIQPCDIFPPLVHIEVIKAQWIINHRAEMRDILDNALKAQ